MNTTAICSSLNDARQSALHEILRPSPRGLDKTVSRRRARTIPSVKSGAKLESIGLAVMFAIMIAVLGCGLVALAL